MSATPTFSTILYEEDGPIARLTLNRPDDGNMFNATMLHEMLEALEACRREVRTRVIVITGAGQRFFCIGGSKDGLEETLGYPGTLPVLDVYSAIEQHPKPVVASVNGFAVGGGHVLHVVCDLTIAADTAVFRQVGPSMGSFDAGYGTWYLEDLVGRKRAKAIWFLNDKLSAAEALEMGLINKVVPAAALADETTAMAMQLAQRGSAALAAVKASFTARHNGVLGLSRITSDLLLPQYLRTEEAAELASSFKAHRPPDPSKFNR